MKGKHIISLLIALVMMANICSISLTMAEEDVPSFSVEVVADAPAAKAPQSASEAEPSAKEADSTTNDALGDGNTEAAEEPSTEETTDEKEVDKYGVETYDGLRVEHRQPSEEIDENKGRPGAQPGDPAETGLPEGYDIFINPETGIYEVTYTIQEGTDAETLNLDLAAVRDMLAEYAAVTSSSWLEPGDTRQFCVYINTDSLHTYKYVDGSFILTTPDLSEDADAIPEEPTVGFDGQALPEGAGYTYVGPNKTPICVTTPPMYELFKALNMDCVANANRYQDVKSHMSADDALTLNNYLNEKYGTTDLESGLEAYLLERYSEADGTAYTSIDEALNNSELAYRELRVEVGDQYELSVDKKTFTNTNVMTSLNGGKNVSSTSTLLMALKNAINEGIGTNYTETSLSKLKTQLEADGRTDIAALIPTSCSSSNYAKVFLNVYNAVHGSNTACYEQYKANLIAEGWDADKIKISDSVTPDSGRYATPLYVDAEKGFGFAADSANRYNNFYNNLLSFLYDKDELTDELGGTTLLQTTTKNEYTITDMDDGKVYEHCVLGKEIRPTFVDELRQWFGPSIPDDILVWVDPKTGDIIWGFGTGNPDDKYATASNSQDCISATYTTTQVEYAEDSLHTDGIAASVGEFMKGADEEAWRTTNDMFNELLVQGLTASDAAKQAVSFYMAINLDGKGTGNDYQDTEWDWDNTIQLERVDYQLNLDKVDEDGNTITDSETSFQLWYYNNGDVNDKYYVVEREDVDGNKTYSSVKYDEGNKEINYTLTTTGGKLSVDYTMLKDIVYYLQEVIAPDGYELDTTVTIICDESDIDAIEDETERETVRRELHENLEALLNEDGNEHEGVDFHGDKISVKDGITIKVVNKKKDEPDNPPTPKDPPEGDVPPNPIITFEDYGVPLAGGINMNEGDCFN